MNLILQLHRWLQWLIYLGTFFTKQSCPCGYEGYLYITSLKKNIPATVYESYVAVYWKYILRIIVSTGFCLLEVFQEEQVWLEQNFSGGMLYWKIPDTACWSGKSVFIPAQQLSEELEHLDLWYQYKLASFLKNG